MCKLKTEPSLPENPPNDTSLGGRFGVGDLKLKQQGIELHTKSESE